MQTLNLRYATGDDAARIAGIINEVSEGAVEALLGNMVPGLSAEKILELALGRGIEPYALRNVLLAEYGDVLAGMVFFYPDEYQQIPEIMGTMIRGDCIEALKPLLEAKTGDSLWINTLWVNPELRGGGLADLLIDAVENDARERSFRHLALHCWADNARALKFYARMGFAEAGHIRTGGELEKSHPAGGLLLLRAVAQSNAS